MEACDVVTDADELELVAFGVDVDEEEVDVVEEAEAEIEDVATIHWSFWQL